MKKDHSAEVNVYGRWELANHFGALHEFEKGVNIARRWGAGKVSIAPVRCCFGEPELAGCWKVEFEFGEGDEWWLLKPEGGTCVVDEEMEDKSETN